MSGAFCGAADDDESVRVINRAQKASYACWCDCAAF
jgi:hypothetical protein